MGRVLVCALALCGVAGAQDHRSRIDVEHYTIDADVNGKTQSLAARVAVKFVPLETGRRQRCVRTEQCAERFRR